MKAHALGTLSQLSIRETPEGKKKKIIRKSSAENELKIQNYKPHSQ